MVASTDSRNKDVNLFGGGEHYSTYCNFFSPAACDWLGIINLSKGNSVVIVGVQHEMVIRSHQHLLRHRIRWDTGINRHFLILWGNHNPMQEMNTSSTNSHTNHNRK